MKDWELVIGLEIHVQLNTRSKLFSSAPNHFGDEPNTNIGIVCTGQPGALPILNREAVRKAALFGLAVQGKVSLNSSFDRKSYFYPDSPRNFQITQFDNPIVRGGHLLANVDGVEKRFAINRAHLEDDAGMLKHFTNFAGVDYNRAGAPLIEIVSEPCIHSAKEASAYASGIRSLMLFLDVSDGNMEEGSLRMDVNISVRRKGETTLRPRVEIKNMNSFHFLEMAVEAEFQRQVKLYTDNPNRPLLELIPPGTYRWDSERKAVIFMRAKESSDDYRYFPEPDIAPVTLTQSYLDEIRSTLPELPYERFKRYLSDFGLPPSSAAILIQEKALSDYFEEALTICQNPRSLCNWMTIEFAGRLKESGRTLLTLGTPVIHLATLVQLIDRGEITGPIAKAIADQMVLSPQTDPREIIAKNPDFQPMNASTDIEPIVSQVLEENPQSVADYKAGRTKAFGFLVGQVMQRTRGKASPQVVNELLRSRLDQ
jgi:aspartyl-tRNA(Asn)/glutamyl-tRNA(Gln) amidotransferase subunit B